jgi:hypothetical protein
MQELATAAGGLPFALFALGFAGMAWADVGWPERLGGMDSFLKFAMIPLLIAQFHRSDRGLQAVTGYLLSCTVLLIVSFVLMVWPPIDPENFGVPVKTATTQSGEFILCILVLPYLAIELYRRGRTWLALGVSLFTLAFLANVVVVVTATLLTRFFFILVLPLIVMPILILMLLIKRQFGRASALAVMALGIAVAGTAWMASSDLRQGAATAWLIIADYAKKPESRPAYWQKSIGFIAEAPIVGHGTGSTLQLFSRPSEDPVGQSAPPTTNPHQQTLAIGIQIGFIGMALLWAMWIAHLVLFRGNTLMDWIGTVIVVQSITSSLLDTLLFDFTQGWTYVFGVGVAGGMIRKLSGRNRGTVQAPTSTMY